MSDIYKDRLKDRLAWLDMMIDQSNNLLLYYTDSKRAKVLKDHIQELIKTRIVLELRSTE